MEPHSSDSMCLTAELADVGQRATASTDYGHENPPGPLSGRDRKVASPGQGPCGKTQWWGRPLCIWAASPSMTIWPPLRLAWLG